MKTLKKNNLFLIKRKTIRKIKAKTKKYKNKKYKKKLVKTKKIIGGSGAPQVPPSEEKPHPVIKDILALTPDCPQDGNGGCNGGKTIINMIDNNKTNLQQMIKNIEQGRKNTVDGAIMMLDKIIRVIKRTYNWSD